MKILFKISLIIFMAFFPSVAAFAQKPVSEMTREDVLSLEYDELIEYQLNDLMKFAEIVGVSVQELQDMILNPKQTTASKYAEDHFSSPLSMTVISADEIEKSGATCIPEVLKLVPGIIVRQKTNGNYDVHIRGNDYVPPGEKILMSENSSTLVMIDKRPVYNYFQGGTYWETLPIGLNDIERIEVVRGPSSALYGPNAVSGVIHIITKKELKSKPTFDANICAGTYDALGGSLSAAVGIGKKFRFRASANFDKRSRFTEKYFDLHRGKYWNLEEMLPHIEENNYGTYSSIDEAFENSELSTNNFGVNVFTDWDITKNISLHYDFGYQKSDVQTCFVEFGTFISRRQSETFSSDIKLKLWDGEIHLSTIEGVQDLAKGVRGFKFDTYSYNAIASYNFKFGDFVFTPGFLAQACQYNDSLYVDIEYHEGFINGSKWLGTVEFNFRLDYRPTDRLRFTAAYATGAYSKPEKPYYSYQLVSSLKIDDNNMMRVVYSRANSSPFIAPTYSNYTTLFEEHHQAVDVFSIYQYLGNQDLDLPVMHLAELGYRNKLLKNLYSDVEVFYSRTENFNAAINTIDDVVVLDTTTVVLFQTDQVITLPIVSNQFGVSASFQLAWGKNFKLRAFGTLQYTLLEDVEVRDSLILNQFTGLSIDRFSLQNNPALINMEHTYTPSFYGGITADYVLFDKLTLGLNLYFTSKQSTFYKQHRTRQKTLDARISANLMVNYEITKGINTYVSARNLSSSEDSEFIFLDSVKKMFFFGIRGKF